ncbi:hypothetical protein ASG43_13690 [Aureimonas sp. Leaf454]|uniref:DUF2125 domain-containing protein n=1 Tax=Aureimonas sp. Leaf454 TaxID=1736381 RepID=UPI0006FA3952|nr:DUF2125 domain-containing protein [Aureimonas sp. Leaf454]KQT44402.1 hypothetical protein ASG43_13690 [Aureimonas sp. Leaf454]
MPASTLNEHRRTRRAFLWIAIVAVLLFAALSAAWFVLAQRLETATSQWLTRSAQSGVLVSCDNQDVFGYPFRLGVRCDATGVDAGAAGTTLTAGALRTAGQIYDPTRFVAELDGPLVVDTAEAPPLDLRWRLAQASAHVWTTGLDRLSLLVEAPEIALAEPAAGRRPLARSDRLEAHVRRRGDALDIAVSDRGIVMLEPALAGLPTFDVSADASVEGAAGWLTGQAGATLGEALAGRTGTIRSLKIALAPPGGTGGASNAVAAPASAEISGPFQVSADRRLSGSFEIALTDPGAIAALVGRLNPALAGTAGTVASAVGFAGRTEGGRTLIDVTVRDGQATLGFVPLGTIPPLR